MLRKRFLMAVASVAFSSAIATNAHAVLSTWDFTAGPNGNFSNPLSVDSDDGNEIKVWGYSSGFTSFFPQGGETQEQVARRSGGVGVRSNFLDSSQIDDFGRNEFLVLQLPTDQWQAISITLTSVGGNDDYRLLAARDGAVTDNGNDLDFSNAIGDYIELAADDGGGTVTLDLTSDGVIQTEYIIAVADGRGIFNPDNNDFRVSEFVGQNLEVSEPAAFGILALGLIGVGVVRRRQRP